MTIETNTMDVTWRKGKKALLRPFEAEDVPYFRYWINDPENNVYLMRTSPVSQFEQQQWYESAQVSDPDRLRVAICTHERKLIGNTELRVDRIKQSATTGTLIGDKDYQSQGYGTDAKMLMLDYAFNWLGLRKVTSPILGFNGRSQRYAEKCGYRHMATIEQEHFRNGEWVDEVHFVVFRDDWLPLWEEYKDSM